MKSRLKPQSLPLFNKDNEHKNCEVRPLKVQILTHLRCFVVTYSHVEKKVHPLSILKFHVSGHYKNAHI